MSSTYHILCVSHDPAIVVTSHGWNAPELAIAAIKDRSEGAAVGHRNCHLLVGRYSYPLIQVTCPASQLHSGGYHPNADEVIDASWLRLLAMSTPDQACLAHLPSCWTHATAVALRRELDIEAAS